jgi:hypothetical protein
MLICFGRQFKHLNMTTHDISQAAISHYCALGIIEKPLMRKGAPRRFNSV